MQAASGKAITAAEESTEEPPPTRRRVRLRLLFVAVALLGLALDVVTKIIAVALLDERRPVELLGGVLTLNLIRNPGAAFSLGEEFTIVFTVLSLAVLAFVCARLAPRLGHPGWAVALGLLAAGISGNLSDRIFREPEFLHGHVVDFLQLPYWPIFNVADMCIVAAAVLIMVLSVIKNVSVDGTRYVDPKRKPKEKADSGADTDTADTDTASRDEE